MSIKRNYVAEVDKAPLTARAIRAQTKAQRTQGLESTQNDLKQYAYSYYK